MPGFGSSIRICTLKIVIIIIASCAFDKKKVIYILTLEPQNSLLVINNKDMLGQFLLILHIIISGFP